MPATSAASLALAARLRELDDAALARVIRERGIAPSGLRDIFDLAEALLDAAVIDRTLAGLSRPTLAALATAAERDAPLNVPELAALVDRAPDEVRTALLPALDALLADLVDDTVTVWPAVAEVLADWPARDLPDAAALRLAPPPPVLAPVDDVDRHALDRAAADQAFGIATARSSSPAAGSRCPRRSAWRARRAARSTTFRRSSTCSRARACWSPAPESCTPQRPRRPRPPAPRPRAGAPSPRAGCRRCRPG